MEQSLKDPAEESYLRYFYRDRRPTRFGRLWNCAYAWMSGLGLTPQVLITLQVRARSSGRLCSTILVGASFEGSRYVVSMLGENSDWVKNVRAAGGEGFHQAGSVASGHPKGDSPRGPSSHPEDLEPGRHKRSPAPAHFARGANVRV